MFMKYGPQIAKTRVDTTERGLIFYTGPYGEPPL